MYGALELLLDRLNPVYWLVEAFERQELCHRENCGHKIGQHRGDAHVRGACNVPGCKCSSVVDNYPNILF